MWSRREAFPWQFYKPPTLHQTKIHPAMFSKGRKVHPGGSHPSFLMEGWKLGGRETAENSHAGWQNLTNY